MTKQTSKKKLTKEDALALLDTYEKLHKDLDVIEKDVRALTHAVEEKHGVHAQKKAYQQILDTKE